MTCILFNVAHTMINTPPLSTRVVASFLKDLKLDFQSIGIGMRNRYVSVETFKMKDTQRIGFEIAAWQAFPGSGFICQ